MVAMLGFWAFFIFVGAILAWIEELLTYLVGPELAHLLSNIIGIDMLIVGGAGLVATIVYEAYTTTKKSRHNDFERKTQGLADAQGVSYTYNPYDDHSNHHP